METLTLPGKSVLSSLKIDSIAYGNWSVGCFIHFGKTLTEEHYHLCDSLAYESGIRTFMTAYIYGSGKADSLLGLALELFPRDSYKLIGAIGHDFYEGKRQGNNDDPRFTIPELRGPVDYGTFLMMAAERCQTDKFDFPLLHNPNETGFPNVFQVGQSDIKPSEMSPAIYRQ
ncbi:MAG: hypothetical protein ACON4R_15465 [Akkermansiaceae bacterium]